MGVEVPLQGGRVTIGVVRVGETVRRPATPHSPFVRRLLTYLVEAGFDGSPRHLGYDACVRDVLSYLPGEVPPELDAAIADETLVAAAQLIRRFHDATAGSELMAGAEVVCHNDLSPCNTVFRDGEPVGLIDYDAAAPGTRLDDLGYAIFLWLNLGTDGPQPAEQARRIELFCTAYGIEANARVVEAIETAVERNLERLKADGRIADTEWWSEQLTWLQRNRRNLTQLSRCQT